MLYQQLSTTTRTDWGKKISLRLREIETLAPTGPDELERAARLVDHIRKEGGGTYGDAIRALRA